MKFYFLKLCWKNIWRNKRRTLLTVNAIALGVMALVFLHNYYDSFHAQVVGNVIRYHSGHLAVSYADFEKNHSANEFIKDAGGVRHWLSTHSEIEVTSPRVFVQGLISSAHGSSNLAVMGIEPQFESKLTQFSNRLIAGDFLNGPEKNGIVIGSGIAKVLKSEIGSKVVVLTQGVDGSVGNELYFVKGIFETGSDADKTLAFMNLDSARGILSLPPDAVHQVAVLLKKESELSTIRGQFETAFKGMEGLKIFSWKELQRSVVAMIELDRAVNRILMFLILSVAVIGIANSILMSIMERKREFGVMLALGTSKKEVVSMVVTETLLLTFVGVGLGNLFGILITTFFHTVGFDLRWLTSKDFVISGTLVQTVSYPTVNLENSLIISLVIISLAALVSFWPAKHVGNLSPIKALRSL